MQHDPCRILATYDHDLLFFFQVSDNLPVPELIECVDFRVTFTLNGHPVTRSDESLIDYDDKLKLPDLPSVSSNSFLKGFLENSVPISYSDSVTETISINRSNRSSRSTSSQFIFKQRPGNTQSERCIISIWCQKENFSF